MFEILKQSGVGSFATENLISTLGFIGFFSLCIITLVVVMKYVKDMQKDNAPTAPLAEHNWDGIGEYKNDLPFGYFASFFIAMIWAAWYYVMGYPLNAYSQIGEWNEEVTKYNQKFESKWSSLDKDTELKMGKSIYLSKCAPCHGETGDGMNGKAANLNDFGREAHIKSVIKNGSKGLGFPMGEMPAGLVPDEANVAKIAAYVATLHGAKASNESLVAEGKTLFEGTCGACHGADGKGNGGQSPDLTQYGTPAYIADIVLKRGKVGAIGNMPSFDKEGTLNPVQYKAVSAYILSDK
jgi:cytochrome c oxidase cbb3-type subunit 3